MEKLVYLGFQEQELPGCELRTALIEKAAPALRAGGARDITVNVDDEAVAGGSPIRRSDPPIRAMISFWMHCSPSSYAQSRLVSVRRWSSRSFSS